MKCLSSTLAGAHPVRNFAKPCTLCLGTVLAASLVLAEIATMSHVVPEQGVDLLVSNAYAS